MKTKFIENNKLLELIFNKHFFIKIKYNINNNIGLIENFSLISSNKYEELENIINNFNNKEEIWNNIALSIYNTGYGFNEKLYNDFKNKKIDSKNFLYYLYKGLI